jgi:hypothetical protein
MDSASATAPREALIKHHHMNYYKTVQFTSQKISQRPDDKLEWQQGKWLTKLTAILVGVITFPLPFVIVVTQKVDMGMLRIGIKG